VAIGIDEGRSVEAIASGPGDLEGGVGFLEGDGFWVAVAGDPCGEAIGRVEEPRYTDKILTFQKLTDIA
jgi:hypothetical protein